MIAAIVAVIVGLTTLLGAGAEYPRPISYYTSDFVAGGIERGTPIYRPGEFVGIEWQCDPADPQYTADPDDADYCYAGTVWIDGVPTRQTGP